MKICRPWLGVGAAMVAVALSAPGRAAPGASGRAVKLPGRCVDPTVDAARRLGSADRPLAPEELTVMDTVDLDGDRVADVRAADQGWCGSGGCAQWLIYVRRGACGHFVGSASGQDLRVVARRRGLADVSIERHGGYCPFNEDVLRFDGRELRLRRSRECDCASSVAGRDMPVTPARSPDLRCTRWSPPAQK